MHSAIYQGNLRHRRFYPKLHDFSYSSTLFYIDLDELPDLFNGVLGWSFNRKNFGSFLRADFLGDPALPLKESVRNEVNALLAAGNDSSLTCPDGAVRMLTNLRIFGFCFNPVTFYYLFNAHTDKPAMILAQVNNTPWNQRHTYLIHCDKTTGKANSQFDKKFHVSPFNPLDMEYHWISSVPAESVLVHMENHSRTKNAPEGVEQLSCHMDATLTLKRKPWSILSLQKILWLQPWTAIKVPIAIYWQAVRLFVKGVPVYTHKSIHPLPASASADLKTTGE